ncbi:hypothetical protein EU800_22740, partial [Tropicimonas sp. IMCC6043]
CIDLIRSEMKVSERRICRVLGQHRSTQRRRPRGRADEDCLVARRPTHLATAEFSFKSLQCSRINRHPPKSHGIRRLEALFRIRNEVCPYGAGHLGFRSAIAEVWSEKCRRGGKLFHGTRRAKIPGGYCVGSPAPHLIVPPAHRQIETSAERQGTETC